MIEAYTSGAFDFEKYAQHKTNPKERLKKELILNNLSHNMLWKGFMAAALAKPDARDNLFDVFMGTTDDNNDSSRGEVRVNKLTAEKFKELSSEQKRKLYDDIVSKIRASRQHESK